MANRDTDDRKAQTSTIFPVTFNTAVGCLGAFGVLLTAVATVWTILQPQQAITIIQQVANVPTGQPVVITISSAIQPTYTPLPTYTPYPTPNSISQIPTAAPQENTATPVGSTNQVFTVEKTAFGRPFETGLYVQTGDHLTISYVSGQWWIGQKLNNQWVPQTPTDGLGYEGREGDRVASLLGKDNPNECRPLPTAPFGSLVGQIGQGGFFYIGNKSELVAQDSGILYLLTNYYNHNKVTQCPYGDGGSISVRVEASPAAN